MSNPSQSKPQSVPVDPAMLAALGAVDRSLRFPVVFFTGCAILWLILASVLALVTSIQSFQPDFLSSLPCFTYGRLYPLASNAMLFGWGCNAIFAVSLWLIARLSMAPVRDGGILMIAGSFWNFGLTLGMFGILSGDFIPVESLELPGYATPILLIAYALIGAWGVQAFLSRQKKTVNVSQWYVLGALFWFPWIYMIAQFMVVWFPVRGVVQSIVSHWFNASFLNLWFTPIALAVAYYLIPKILGRPIYSYSLALFGFCSLVLVGSWTGMVHMIGGPIPIWLSSTSIVASVIMIMPVGVVVLNLFLSVKGSFAEMWRSLALRFVLFGIGSYLLAGIFGSAMAFHSVSEIVHFTTAISAYHQQLIYAFFSMVMFGGLYFMVPRLSGREWPSADLIYLHFWGSAVGILIIVFALFVGGLISGIQMNDPEVPFVEIAESLVIWLKMNSIGIICLMVGHLAFAVNFFWLLVAGHLVSSKQGSVVLESTNQEGTT
jgi:cytochrome c oxidase cbb3-type subunit 1